MKFDIIKETFLNNVYQLNYILNTNNLYIYNNILLKVKNNILLVTHANQEMEIISKVKLCGNSEDGSITVSTKNFINIFKNLPDNSEILIKLEKDLIFMKTKKIKFCLSTLPSNNFPSIDKWIIKNQLEFILNQHVFKNIINSTYFSISNNDIKYSLNGIFLEIKKNIIQCTASDGHRLSICTLYITQELPFCSIIIPKKGILEIMRLLKKGDMKLQIGKNNIRIYIKNLIFTSKLINGNYPNYKNLLDNKKGESFEINSDDFKEAIKRVSILASEKFNIVYLILNKNNLKIKTYKPPKEKAEEFIEIIYNGPKIKIGVNLNYILSILNSFVKKYIKILIKDLDNSIQITYISKNIKYLHIIMPIVI
ncbi:DNA polymerase III subunit beta [Enterobacteriaceae bacterium ET-AT1-13]|nr:DNA polymerase III subunit beta [Enterobacteriaceae bacterium ET-AT1-13]WGS66382.1 DNA polymerase III subunit beta [Enterobacteriaceae bacterium Cmel17]WMC17408.1 MAG: DNA polymerase III subunit beta [Enterobacteriaceae bacterium Cmel21]WMC17614.1 MAG: DNA polymerase III subunit beta [Enterobacteriaceae bacterium PSmelAO3-2]WMC17819.1 MAG: DNA polymerase III subunit beta [Enterobacteriaceae bacterium PSmelAO3-1]WMC18022.1 MAG: DNA polymerase III subunit beta [Enterobacteriaceae bacterium PS